MVGPVTAATTAWMDRWWDDDAGLLWNPPGSFEGVVEPRSVHLVRETAWYAIGLLRRDGPRRPGRAEAALDAVVGHQYDEPGQPWHGTFVRFPEWAAADGGRDGVDRLRPELAPVPRHRPGGGHHRLRSAHRASPRGPATPSTSPWTPEPPDRVPPTYANIALLRAWLDAWAGEPTTATPRAIVDTFRRHGCFTEYGSPTYYGIDLLALGPLAATAMPPTRCSATARRLEAALWDDIARWWHAGLGNLCGPYSRAYGMDLGSYVSGLSLALWCAGLPAPLPSLDADVVPHGHDVCMAPMLEHVGVRVPADGCGRPSSASTAPARSAR